MNPQHQIGAGNQRQGQPVYYVQYPGVQHPQAGYHAAYNSYYRAPPPVPAHMVNNQYPMPPPTVYPPPVQQYQYNPQPPQTYVSGSDQQQQQHTFRPAPAGTPPSTLVPHQPGQYGSPQSATPPGASPGYSGAGGYPWSTAVSPPTPVYTFTGERTSPHHVPYPLPPRLKLLGELHGQGTGVDPSLQQTTQLDSSQASQSQPYKQLNPTITTTAGSSDIFQQKASQYGIVIENPTLTNNTTTTTQSKGANDTTTSTNFIKPSVSLQKDTNFTINPSTPNFKPYENINTSAVPKASILPIKRKNASTLPMRNDEKTEGLQKHVKVEATTSQDDNNSAASQTRFGSLFNRVIQTMQRQNSREDRHSRSSSTSPVNLDEATQSPFPSVTGINLDILTNCVEAHKHINVACDESFKSAGETFDENLEEDDFFDDACIIEEHEFLSFDVISSPFDICNRPSSTEEEEDISVEDNLRIQNTVINNMGNTHDDVVKCLDNNVAETAESKFLENFTESESIFMKGEQSKINCSIEKNSIKDFYAKQILESEKCQADIILKGIHDDESITELASAIVESVIANAILDVIDQPEAGDINETLADTTVRAENNKDSAISTENIEFVEVEKHTDSKDNSEIMQDNVEDVQNENIEIITSNVDEDIVKTVDDNIKSETFDDETDYIHNMSDDSGGKNRLYSWPYSDTDQEAGETETDMGMDTNVEDPETNQEECFEQPIENSIVVNIKKTQKESEDFEKQYFKSRASLHGITITSPEKAVKGIDSKGTNSNSIDNQQHMKNNITRHAIRSFERRESTDSDIYSTDSQNDAGEAFIMKAKNLGIKIEHPKELESSMDVSDIELEAAAADKMKTSESSSNGQQRRTSTPTMMVIGNNLNPDSPEWMPGWKRGAKSEMSVDAPTFTPEGRNRHISHNSSSASLNNSGYNEMLRVDAPVFKPDGVQRLNSETVTAMRVSAMEFQPRITAPAFQPHPNAETFQCNPETTTQDLIKEKYNIERSQSESPGKANDLIKPPEPTYNLERPSESPSKSKVFYLPTPKPKIEKPVKCIQASPTITETGMNTRRIRTKDFGMATGGADSRDVAINTEDSQSSPDSQYYIDKQPLVLMSKSTNTDQVSKRSVGVNVRGRSSAAVRSVATLTDPVAEKVIPSPRDTHHAHTDYLLDKVKKLQIEVITFKADAEVDRLKNISLTLSKQAAVWIDIFSEWKDAEEMNQLVRNKMRTLHQSRKTVMDLCRSTVARIESGWVYDELPDLRSTPRSPEPLTPLDKQKDKQAKPPLSPAFDSNIQFPKIDVSSILATRTPSALIVETTPDTKPKHNLKSPGKFTHQATSPGKPEGHVTEMRRHVTTHVTNQMPQKVSLTNQTSPSVDLAGTLQELEDIDMQQKVDSIGAADTNINKNNQRKSTSLMALEDYSDENNQRKSTSLMALEDYSDDEREDDSINMNEIDDCIIKPNKTQSDTAASYGANVVDVKQLISKTMEKEYTGKGDQEKSNDDALVTPVSESISELSDNVKNLAEIKASLDGNKKEEEPSILPVNDIGLDDDNVVVIKDAGLEMPDSADNVLVNPYTKLETDQSPVKFNDLPDEVKKWVTPPRELKRKDGNDKMQEDEDMGAVGDESSKVSNVKLPDVSTGKELPEETPVPDVKLPVRTPVLDVHNKSDIFVSPPAAYSTPEKLFSENKKKASMEVVPTLETAPVASQNLPMMLGGIDPVLYQFVVSQLVQAYPDLAANPDMLCNVAIQQTSILCQYMASDQVAGATGATNVLGTMDQGMLGTIEPGILGTVDPGMLGSMDQGMLGNFDPGILGNVNLGMLGTGPAQHPVPSEQTDQNEQKASDTNSQQEPMSFKTSPVPDDQIQSTTGTKQTTVTGVKQTTGSSQVGITRPEKTKTDNVPETVTPISQLSAKENNSSNIESNIPPPSTLDGQNSNTENIPVDSNTDTPLSDVPPVPSSQKTDNASLKHSLRRTNVPSPAEKEPLPVVPNIKPDTGKQNVSVGKVPLPIVPNIRQDLRKRNLSEGKEPLPIVTKIRPDLRKRNMSGGKDPLPIVPIVKPEIRKTNLSKPAVKESSLKPLYPNKEAEVSRPPGLRHLDEKKAGDLIPAPGRMVKPVGFGTAMKFVAGSQSGNVPHSATPSFNLQAPPPNQALPSLPSETNQADWPKPTTNQQPPKTSQPNLLKLGFNDKPLMGYDSKVSMSGFDTKLGFPPSGFVNKPPPTGFNKMMEPKPLRRPMGMAASFGLVTSTQNQPSLVPPSTGPDPSLRFTPEPARSPTPPIPPSTDFLPPFMKLQQQGMNGPSGGPARADSANWRDPYRSNLPPRLQRKLSGNQTYEARMEERVNENWNDNASGSSRYTGGIEDIPTPKVEKSEKGENDEGKEGAEQEEWSQVPSRKKKAKELKKFSAPYLNSVPVPSPQIQRSSNFERLVSKIQEDFPNSGRQEVIDTITEIRSQRGTMTGMNMTEILEKAFSILQRKSRQTFMGNWPQNQLQFSRTVTGPPLPAADEEEDMCVICHDPLSSEPTKSLDCGHAFHEACINKWVYGHERTCPTCRQHALLPEDFPRLGK